MLCPTCGHGCDPSRSPPPSVSFAQKVDSRDCMGTPGTPGPPKHMGAQLLCFPDCPVSRVPAQLMNITGEELAEPGGGGWTRQWG